MFKVAILQKRAIHAQIDKNIILLHIVMSKSRNISIRQSL